MSAIFLGGSGLSWALGVKPRRVAVVNCRMSRVSLMSNPITSWRGSEYA